MLQSLMVCIPKQGEDISLETVLYRIKNNSLLEYKAKSGGDKNMELVVTINGKDVRFTVAKRDGLEELPYNYRRLGNFKEDEYREMEACKEKLIMAMDYEGEPHEEFHNQLKIIHVMIPNLLAILDCSTENILNGKWVALAAESATTPLTRYLFCVQIIKGKKTNWLHTHGLRRLGLPELEILDSDNENFDAHYNVIEVFAEQMIRSSIDEPMEEGDSIYIASLENDIPLICTMLNWKDAVKYYRGLKQGRAKDRDEWHSEETNVIMVYTGPDEEAHKKYSKLQIYDKIISNNPMFYRSSDETDRMESLARERAVYLKKIMSEAGSEALVKIGLDTEERYHEITSREHIWFEVIEIGDNYIKAELTQEPYYIDNLHTGDVREFKFEQLTDWLACYRNMRITPNNVYLIDDN